MLARVTVVLTDRTTDPGPLVECFENRASAGVGRFTWLRRVLEGELGADVLAVLLDEAVPALIPFLEGAGFVETAEQAHALFDLGCTTVQGYLFARPQTAESVESSWRGTGSEGQSGARGLLGIVVRAVQKIIPRHARVA